MEDNGKRRVGRPRLVPQTGPLVLEGGRARVTVELEIAEKTADELKEYAGWVELSSAVGTKDALFKTVDFALRDVFRRDRLWQERRKDRDHRDSPPAPQALPSAAVPLPPSPPPTQPPRPLPPPTVTSSGAPPKAPPSAGRP